MISLLLALLASCSVDRRDVKYMADGLAIAVNRSAVATTIEHLAALPVPDPRVRGNEGRGLPGLEEFQVFSIEGTVFLARLEEDGDIHLGLRGDTARMIVEVVDPRCAARSYVRDEIRDVRRTVRRLLGWRPLTDVALYRRLVGRRLRVIGPVFFDAPHGQRGAARNLVEIHPVLELEVIQ